MCPDLAAVNVIHSVMLSRELQPSADGLFYTLLVWNTVGGYYIYHSYNINVFHFELS